MFIGSGKMMRTPPQGQGNPAPSRENPPMSSQTNTPTTLENQITTPENPSTSQENPIPEQEIMEPSDSHLLDPTQQSCTMCTDLDTIEMVKCDGCKNWLHFECAGVTSEIAEKEFVCQRCMVDVSAASQRRSNARSRKSKSSSSSAARSEARRKQLALERLEEERKLSEARDRQYLDKKYKTLEQFSNKSNVDSESEFDEENESRSNASEYTAQWIRSQRKQVETADVTRTSLAIVPETDDLIDVVTIDDSSSVEMENYSSVKESSANKSVVRPTTDAFSKFIESGATEKRTQFVQQNSTFRVNTASQGAVRKPTNLLNWNLSNETPISSSPTFVPSHSVNAPIGSDGYTTTGASAVPSSQTAFVNSRVENIQTLATMQCPPTSKSLMNSVPKANGLNPLSTQRPMAQNYQRPPAIQSTRFSYQGQINNTSTTTQLPGQNYASTNRLTRTGNCTMVSANHIPQLPSYVVSSGHRQSISQTVQSSNTQPIVSQRIANGISIIPDNPPVYATSSNNVTHQRPLWNGGASNAQEFMQWYSQRGQQNGVGTNSHETCYQQVDPQYNQTTSSGHQQNDIFYTRPTSSNTTATNNPFLSEHLMNPSQMSNNNMSAPMSHQNHTNQIHQDDTYGMSLINPRLTSNQIASRQVVGKDLPVFYGDIEKFPAFIRAYETTTEMCGFTNGENLTRLLKCLKGVAMEFVEQQLCYPDDVPQVIETLKTLYNQPEFIIEKLMEKISKQQSPQAEDLVSIVKFSMSVQNICGTIRRAQLTEHLNNPNLMKQLIKKLPPSLQLQWANHRLNFAVVNMNTFGSCLHELAKLASSITGPPKVKRESEHTKSKPKQGSGQSEFVNAQIESSTGTKSTSQPKQPNKCQICSQSSCQRVKDCKKFISLNTKDRWLAVREHELCIRCFGKHLLKTCRSKQKCKVGDCQKAHNPLLHESQGNTVKNDPKEIVAKNDNVDNVNCSHHSVSRKVDIFRIVPVVLYHLGRSMHTFAYLDDGSNVTTIEDELARELDLESSSNENLCVKWSFGKISKTELVSRRVSVKISGVQANAPVYDLHNVRTVTDLALPLQTISSEWLMSYKHFANIPISTYENARPRMLIGLQYSKLMVSQKTIEGQWTEPIVCKTRLGWVVQGPDGGRNNIVQSTYSANICECQPNDDISLNLLVKNFFAWDDFGVRGTNGMIESTEVQRARKILESTTKRINGCFETGLLWRFDEIEFPDSYPMALKRLECLERKMEKDPVLAQKMCDYIQDFLDKKYARKLTTNELQQSTSRVWYLPIFPVFNPKKPAKFRVVWDAAAKVKNVSLNEMLLAGPDLLKPLPDVLRRFREKPIAIAGDMKEMFHQVRVIGPDVHSQRFLWRNGNSNAKPEILVMDVLTFGGKNSPSSAQYVKNSNARENEDKYPRAVDAIINNHYQDDMLENFDTVDETVRITEEVKSIHRRGGFEIRNFISNSSEVLEKLGVKVENHRMNLDISSETTIERVLGMYWNTSSDTFTFSLKFAKLSEEVVNGIRRPTKREVLSAIMSIFDPLGLIAQCLVYAKILLQKIWRDGTDWDQKISDSSYEHWCTWMEVLPEIEQIEIPRWYSPKLLSANRKQIQIHIFVDASEEACAAAVYYRVEDDEGVDCCLVGAKTKVAPTKPLSIPRLELQAAVLGTRLVDNISQCQRIQVSERFFWSDSQTVLGWIQSEARKYHQYVAFRIGEILENTTTNEWHWVDTKNNVADDATKWNKKPDLSATSRWYKAPSFLYQSRENWPFGNDNSKFSTDEEMRSVYLLAHVEVSTNEVIRATNFSNWHRLVRAMAYALRFIDNLRSRKKNRQVGPFSREEYRRARNVLFKQAQREEFLDEVLIIRNNESLDVDNKKELHRSSVLRTCSPYSDEDGLLRVKGRIDAATSITVNTKRPIILPRHNYITKLLILSFHQKFHHVNHQNTLNQIKQMFYIPASRVALKSVIQNLCQRCKNDRAKPVVPEMAELPPERLSTFTRPFNFVGVDYFGPLKVKVRRTPEKRWGVIFTCLTTRAVYIDIAHSLDTASCIYCIRNFSNRHGPPTKFLSDNGGCFRGAEKELREEFQKMNKSKIEETFTTEHTQWSFNPPTAAHMGGIWERPIRTIKSVLKKKMSTRLPTDEMLRSYLIEIENIINSTPLTYVQLDNFDDDVLTPNHFLKGSSNGMKSPGKFDPNSLLRDDWKAVQQMTNQFWRQFVVEYIPTLTRRTKWFNRVKNLEVGDLVVDCDEDSDRNEWRKAIVEEVAIGKGNQIRRAKVRMIRGEKSKLTAVNIMDIRHQSLWRPVAKLAVLDVKDNQLSSSLEPVNGGGNVTNAP